MPDAQGLDQPLHPTGGNACQIGLSDHGYQSPFRPPPRLQQPPGEIAALAQLGDDQADTADPGVPVPLSITVAGVAAFLERSPYSAPQRA